MKLIFHDFIPFFIAAAIWMTIYMVINKDSDPFYKRCATLFFVLAVACSIGKCAA